MADETGVDALTISDRRRLRTLNATVGLTHMVQAAVVIALSNDLALSVTASYLDDDPVQARGPVMATELFAIAIGPAVALFLALAAIDHLAMAGPGVRVWYERNLADGLNSARWIEYSMSASLMIVLIAMFVGIRDIAALLGLVGANSSMILFGWLMERDQRPGDARWAAYWFGCLAGAVPWIAIFWYLLGTRDVPGFVYAITVTQLILFIAFGLTQALQYAQIGRFRSYVFGEATYIVLSLVAKSLLAWIIFANVLRT